ncbi:hypothetical protein HELRODRAFT_173745 [Helobdella robusta]|uniref:Fibrinogen C-terminal domain-containing protein n=1 Tax=Helobdella robusta TaxID=6412 RepID=T1F768_HELRO|nr:hypothetical protein HELRODRAFT_173745 [Helobdella robusta]ESO03448.1 hypothetical protein HELRODRAFT_173745 [Helobdella robusta]
MANILASFIPFKLLKDILKYAANGIGSNTDDNLCSVEKPTSLVNIDIFSFYPLTIDEPTTAVIVCSSLCRYKESNQELCNGFNVRFDSRMCELYRYRPLKPVDSTRQVILPAYPLRSLIHEQSFNKSWSEFKSGFSVSGLTVLSDSESTNTVADTTNSGYSSDNKKTVDGYWLGNELLYRLTNKYRCGLHVLLNYSSSGEPVEYLHYDKFLIESELQNYKVKLPNCTGGGSSPKCVVGSTTGQAANFSTFDKDNVHVLPSATAVVNCPFVYSAGWWYADHPGILGRCGYTNFNTHDPYLLIHDGIESHKLSSTEMWIDCVDDDELFL